MHIAARLLLIFWQDRQWRPSCRNVIGGFAAYAGIVEEIRPANLTIFIQDQVVVVEAL